MSMILLTRFATFAATVALLMSPSAQAQERKWLPVDGAAPVTAQALYDLDGKAFSPQAYRGRVLILNFWATWCAPCVAEMPSLQALAAKFGEQNLVVLGANFRESEEKIRGFQARYNISFPLARDPWHEFSVAWRVKTLPESFIIDRDGLVRYRVVGEVDWMSADTLAKLKPIIDARATPVQK